MRRAVRGWRKRAEASAAILSRPDFPIAALQMALPCRVHHYSIRTRFFFHFKKSPSTPSASEQSSMFNRDRVHAGVFGLRVLLGSTESRPATTRVWCFLLILLNLGSSRSSRRIERSEQFCPRARNHFTSFATRFLLPVVQKRFH